MPDDPTILTAPSETERQGAEAEQSSPRPATDAAAGSSPTRTRIVRAITGLALLSVFPVAWIIHDVVLSGEAPVTCVFRLLTGKSCPFCGLTRAFASATHGQFGAAMDLHRLWWVFAVIILGFGLLSLWDAFADRRDAARTWRLFLKHPKSMGVAIILVWIARQ
jgi:hypothetical protein